MAYYELAIVTKGYRDLKFIIKDDKKQLLYTKLQTMIDNVENSANYMFAQKYYDSLVTLDKLDENTNLWSKYYNQEKEYARQKILYEDSSSDYRLVINENFSISPTYPEMFIIPKNINDRELKEAVRYRLKGRVPGINK